MDRYECIDVIGEGTYGQVLRCRHRDTGAIVAIKRFKDFDASDYVRHSIQRELSIVRLLRDAPYVVPLLDTFYDHDKLHLVMECIPNTLLDLLDRRPRGLPRRRLRVLLYTLLLGVRSCHARGVVHRDIKPENILMRDDGSAYLCDFGFSRPVPRATLSPPPHQPSRDSAQAVAVCSGASASSRASRPDATPVPPAGEGEDDRTRRAHSAGSAADTHVTVSGILPLSCVSADDVVSQRVSCAASEADVMTNYVSTRWYRSPEMLLRMPHYAFEVDMWAVGTILAEAADGMPLLPGKTELEQLTFIQERVGPLPPSYRSRLATLVGNCSGGRGGAARPRVGQATSHHNPLTGPTPPATRDSRRTATGATTPPPLTYLEKRYLGKLGVVGVDLLTRLLAPDAARRLTVQEALAHAFFDGLHEASRSVTATFDERANDGAGETDVNAAAGESATAIASSPRSSPSPCEEDDVRPVRRDTIAPEPAATADDAPRLPRPDVSLQTVAATSVSRSSPSRARTAGQRRGGAQMAQHARAVERTRCTARTLFGHTYGRAAAQGRPPRNAAPRAAARSPLSHRSVSPCLPAETPLGAARDNASPHRPRSSSSSSSSRRSPSASRTPVRHAHETSSLVDVVTACLAACRGDMSDATGAVRLTASEPHNVSPTTPSAVRRGPVCASDAHLCTSSNGNVSLSTTAATVAVRRSTAGCTVRKTSRPRGDADATVGREKASRVTLSAARAGRPRAKAAAMRCVPSPYNTSRTATAHGAMRPRTQRGQFAAAAMTTGSASTLCASLSRGPRCRRLAPLRQPTPPPATHRSRKGVAAVEDDDELTQLHATDCDEAARPTPRELSPLRPCAPRAAADTGGTEDSARRTAPLLLFRSRRAARGALRRTPYGLMQAGLARKTTPTTAAPQHELQPQKTSPELGCECDTTTQPRDASAPRTKTPLLSPIVSATRHATSLVEDDDARQDNRTDSSVVTHSGHCAGPTLRSSASLVLMLPSDQQLTEVNVNLSDVVTRPASTSMLSDVEWLLSPQCNDAVREQKGDEEPVTPHVSHALHDDDDDDDMPHAMCAAKGTCAKATDTMTQETGVRLPGVAMPAATPIIGASDVSLHSICRFQRQFGGRRRKGRLLLAEQ